MLKEKHKSVRLMLIGVDLAVIAAAFCLAYFFREHLEAGVSWIVWGVARPGNFMDAGLYMKAWVLGSLAWFVSLQYCGLYYSFRTSMVFEQIWRLCKAALLSFVLFSVLIFIFKVTLISRIFVGIFMVVAFVLLGVMRVVLLHAAWHMRRLGYNYRCVLVVGTGVRAKELIDMLRKHPEWGMRLVGLLEERRESTGKDLDGVKCLGVIEDVEEILLTETVDEVMVVVPRSVPVQSLVAVCKAQGVRVNLACDLFYLNAVHAVLRDLDGISFFILDMTVGKQWQLIIKRGVDVIVSLLGLIVLAPLFLVTAFLIKITSSGPVFFLQKRVGEGQRCFYLHKFRSMYMDAEARLEQVRHLNEMDGPVFKIKNDPRVTAVGKWIRKFSIDELPQLYDVLLGRMSLVGPRPALPAEVAAYEPWQRRRFSMRPGITCLWQVMGRNKVGFKDWMTLDLEYIDNWSLWLDFKVLMMTGPAVFFAKGAS